MRNCSYACNVFGPSPSAPVLLLLRLLAPSTAFICLNFNLIGTSLMFSDIQVIIQQS